MLAGGCLPAGDGSLPYAPIVEALRPLPSELGVGAVRGLIGSSWSELARLLPVLGEPPSGPAGQAAQARLFELLLGLLGRLGEQAPVLLVVEDLHWAIDRPTSCSWLGSRLSRPQRQMNLRVSAHDSGPRCKACRRWWAWSGSANG